MSNLKTENKEWLLGCDFQPTPEEECLASILSSNFKIVNNSPTTFLKENFSTLINNFHTDHNPQLDDQHPIILLQSLCSKQHIKVMQMDLHPQSSYQVWLNSTIGGSLFKDPQTIYKLSGSIAGETIQMVVEENMAPEIATTKPDHVDLFVAVHDNTEEQHCLGFIRVNKTVTGVGDFGLKTRNVNGEMASLDSVYNSLEIDYLCAANTAYILDRDVKKLVSVVTSITTERCRKYLVMHKDYSTSIVDKVFYEQKRSFVGYILLLYIIIHYSDAGFGSICLTVAQTVTPEVNKALTVQGGVELFASNVYDEQWGEKIYVNAETAAWYHRYFGFQRAFPYSHLSNTVAKLWFRPVEELYIVEKKDEKSKPRSGLMYRLYPSQKEIIAMIGFLAHQSL